MRLLVQKKPQGSNYIYTCLTENNHSQVTWQGFICYYEAPLIIHLNVACGVSEVGSKTTINQR